MKRWLIKVTAVVGVAACIPAMLRAQPPLGPGEQGALLRTSPAEPNPAPKAPRPAPQAPAYPFPFNNPLPTSPVGNPFTSAPAQAKPAPARFNQTDINKDIEVSKDIGPWLIHVMTYTGERAPMQARAFVKMLREDYKYNAHIFNYGAREKAEEYKRAMAEVERQKELLRKDGLTADVPLRVRVSHIPENTTVFIGGFLSQDEAAHVLKTQVRQLTPPDPQKVDLDLKYVGNDVLDDNRNPTGKILVREQTNSAYKNPFKSAFVVHNPALPSENSQPNVEAEVRFLRKVNEGEPLSLFQCKRAFTLAVAQYKTQTILQEGLHEARGFLDKFLMKKAEYQDVAAHNAHNVAAGFRKAGMAETYVLHARNCSYVTIGGYDSPSDPNLLRMQSFLEGQFRQDGWQQFQLMPRPLPMEVPH